MNAKQTTKLEHSIIERTAGATNHITDQHRCLAALAYARQRGFSQATANGIILAKKRSWLNWLSVTQRHWQRETRNVNKAKFGDSITLRENYVRCHV